MGHVRLLQFARAQGDHLIVAINSDASAGRVKGPDRPVVPAHERAEVLSALRCVDDVQIFVDDTPEVLIRRIRPDVLVKGPACRGTEIPGAAFIESIGGRVVIPDWPVEHSSTQLVGRIFRTVGAIGSTCRSTSTERCIVTAVRCGRQWVCCVGTTTRAIE